MVRAKNRFWAMQRIPKPQNKITVAYQDGITNDIINQISTDFSKSYRQTENIAKDFKGANTYETGRNVHSWIRRNIKYKLDPKGQQDIKTPSKTITDGFGDCKAYSILALSILTNLGINCFFRFVRFKPEGDVTHVYCVILENGKEIVLDACLPIFGREKPYREKKDIMTVINSINGFPMPRKKCKCKKRPELVGDIGQEEQDAQVGFLRKLASKARGAVQKAGGLIKKAGNLALKIVPGGDIVTTIQENKKNGKKWWRGLAKNVAMTAVQAGASLAVPGAGGAALKAGMKGAKAIKLAMKAKKALKLAKGAGRLTKNVSKATKALQKGRNILQKGKKLFDKAKNVYQKGQEIYQNFQPQTEQIEEVFQQAYDMNVPQEQVKEMILDNVEAQYRRESQEQSQEQDFEEASEQEYQEEENTNTDLDANDYN